MYLYLESLGKNLAATILGLFIFLQGVSETTGKGEHSALFLLLTITIPSIISGLVTISIELIKNRKRQICAERSRKMRKENEEK